MEDAKDWDELRNAWVDEPTEGPDIDVEHIVRQVRRATSRTLWTIVVEAAIALGALLMIVYDLASGSTPDAYRALAFGLILFSVAATAWARRGPWPNTWETLEELLTVAEQRARSGVRYAIAGYWVAACAIAILVAFVALNTSTGEPLRDSRLVALAMVYVVLMTLWNRRKERERRAELAEIRAMRRTIDAEPTERN